MKRIDLLPVLRQLLLIFLIIICALAQELFFGARVPGIYLLIPMAVSCAIFEKEFAGAFFGILCGALWDLASPVTDGVFALVFALCAFACGLLANYIFRNTLVSALIMNAFFILAVCGVNFVYILISRDTSGMAEYLTRIMLPSALLTEAVLPAFYYPVKFIERKLRRKSEFGI